MRATVQVYGKPCALGTRNGAALAAWRATVKRTLLHHHGKYDGDGFEAVLMHVHFFVKRPKAGKQRRYATHGPALHKLTPVVLEAARGVLFSAERQVVSLDANKHYTDRDAEGVTITFWSNEQ